MTPNEARRLHLVEETMECISADLVAELQEMSGDAPDKTGETRIRIDLATLAVEQRLMREKMDSIDAKIDRAIDAQDDHVSDDERKHHALELARQEVKFEMREMQDDIRNLKSAVQDLTPKKSHSMLKHAQPVGTVSALILAAVAAILQSLSPGKATQQPSTPPAFERPAGGTP
jgi:ElaB/YqjD/DUF883 family membrane-anchored ribosome-binding protein